MSRTYTVTTIDFGEGYKSEALYADGRLIKQAEDGALSTTEVLEAIAFDNIAIRVEYVEAKPFDEDWPDRLESVPT